MDMYTRKEYMEESGVLSIKDMDKERFDLHRKYYSQYVALGGERYIRSVVFSVGQGQILASTDRRLNDIPLRVWEQIPLPIGTRKLAKELGDVCMPSIADGVCIAKEAARQYRERDHSKTDIGIG